MIASYLDRTAQMVREELFEAFRTPYELAIATECISDLHESITRTSLFDTYVRRHLQDSSSCAVMRCVLRDIASQMADRVTTVLPIADAYRIAESTVDRAGMSFRLLDELPRTRLLELSQGRCAFRHELLCRFFQAEAIVTTHTGPPGIASALRDPRNTHLSDLVLEMQTDEDTIRACLQASPSTQILLRAVRGELGERARIIVRHGLCYRASSGA